MRNFLVVLFAEYGVVVLFILTALYVLFVEGVENKLYVLFVVGGSTFFAVVLAKILKRIFKQKRPETTGMIFVPFDEYSFPSGHASGITGLALSLSVFSIEFGIIIAVFGVSVVSARVLAGVHYARDVLGGVFFAAIGTYYVLPFIYAVSERLVSFL